LHDPILADHYQKDAFSGSLARQCGVRFRIAWMACLLLALPISIHAQKKQLSEDRDLKEVDLSHWDCLYKLEGTAKTPDGAERNRLKNRSAPAQIPAKIPKLDFAGFQDFVAGWDNQNKNQRRKDINPMQKKPLPEMENQVVELTGYLGVAYCGPPETTNCGSTDFHDWHLEIFAKPPTRPPAPGDPTAIICEITPRTQNAIYHDNIKLQDLAGYFRDTTLAYERTGHPARKIRLTGYLLWDDEHNGTADVGESVRTAGERKFHNPWRKTAWEIHPVIKIEPADSGVVEKTKPAPESVASPAAPSSVTPTIAPTITPEPVARPPGSLVTIVQPIQLQLPTGNVLIPAGTKFRVRSSNAEYVSVEYLGSVYPVPIGYTDWK
jgi:hypothetical protein